MPESPLPPEAEEGPDAAFLRGVGERLRLTRTRRGMTQRLLSQRSGVSSRYIAQAESGAGNVSVLLLRRLAEALGVPATELLADHAEHPDAQALLGLIRRLPAEDLAAARALLFERFGPRDSPARQARVALIGLRGAGKSTLGRLLAAERGVPFLELDREVERQSGMELAAIFELHGQAGFRRAERAALERLLADRDRAVIAAGGSIVAEPATFDLLLGHCLTVWVRASPAEHMQRVIDQGDLRPMQDNRGAMADLKAILASREQLYARADLTLDTTGHSVEASFAELLRLLRHA
jgi:XRE family aerobic/anaerobic benzoate catabolism transcriptional regulator